MISRFLVGIIMAGGLIQLAPIGHGHDNPAVVREPAWDTPRTRELAKRACFNCHSNETVWPWYSRIAPLSWLTERDVKGGRSHLNFSEWNRPQYDADAAGDEIRAGAMPLWFYLPMHPEARLTSDERRALIDGLQKSLQDSDR
jgi:mono/diheme cytochrome c family protein